MQSSSSFFLLLSFLPKFHALFQFFYFYNLSKWKIWFSIVFYSTLWIHNIDLGADFLSSCIKWNVKKVAEHFSIQFWNYLFVWINKYIHYLFSPLSRITLIEREDRNNAFIVLKAHSWRSIRPLSMTIAPI